MEKDDWRVVREALLTAGCDKGSVKQWQKKYEWLLKQHPQTKEQYQRARNATSRVEELARIMDQMLVQEKPPGREAQKRFSEVFRELKQLRGTFDHEFLVSREDREFHSTYDSILKLGVQALEEQEQRLLLQSETENLLSLLEEDLMKERPELLALTVFYQGHTDAELVDLPPAERLARIEAVYREEFYAPIEALLLTAIPLADSRMDELLKARDRRSRSEAEQLGILWNRPGEQRPARVRAEWIIKELIGG